MKNKNKKTKHFKFSFNDRINLRLPCILLAIFLILSGILMIYSGNIYIYYWIILPRGAISLWLFVMLFIISFAFLGALFGAVLAENRMFSKKLKIVLSTFLGLATVLTVMWYDCVFAAHAFTFSFLLSLLMLICIFMAFLVLICKRSIVAVGTGMLTLWYMYLFWFSFCIMIIN
ncbi:MAG: hypothetical protein E7675_03490 [Ruminococcaceae bacterium]|nr:hypothetical protein [Oscillospiraceae bacterium]